MASVESHFDDMYKGNCLGCEKELRRVVEQVYCGDCIRSCMKCKARLEYHTRVNCASCEPIKTKVCNRCRVAKVSGSGNCGKCEREIEELRSKDERWVYEQKVQRACSSSHEAAHRMTLCIKRAEILRRLTIIAMEEEEKRLRSLGVEADLVSKVGRPATVECDFWAADSSGCFDQPEDSDYGDEIDYSETKEDLQKALSIIDEELPPLVGIDVDLTEDFKELTQEVRRVVGEKITLELNKSTEEAKTVAKEIIKEEVREEVRKEIEEIKKAYQEEANKVKEESKKEVEKSFNARVALRKEFNEAIDETSRIRRALNKAKRESRKAFNRLKQSEDEANKTMEELLQTEDEANKTKEELDKTKEEFQEVKNDLFEANQEIDRLQAPYEKLLVAIESEKYALKKAEKLRRENEELKKRVESFGGGSGVISADEALSLRERTKRAVWDSADAKRDVRELKEKVSKLERENEELKATH